MAISFDPAKRRRNLAKHGIDLADCEAVFDHDVLTWEDLDSEGEVRLISVGLLKGRVVVLVWTDRESVTHAISCREAERHEQEAYFQAFY
ncbi:MAG: BrnT family toxin [Burkholderiales bacterium]